MIAFSKRTENCIDDAPSLGQQFTIGSIQSHSKARPRIQTQTNSSAEVCHFQRLSHTKKANSTPQITHVAN